MIVALVGNAAEHGGAIVTARRGNPASAPRSRSRRRCRWPCCVAPVVALLSGLVGRGPPARVPPGRDRDDGAPPRSRSSWSIFDSRARRWEGFAARRRLRRRPSACTGSPATADGQLGVGSWVAREQVAGPDHPVALDAQALAALPALDGAEAALGTRLEHGRLDPPRRAGHPRRQLAPPPTRRRTRFPPTTSGRGAQRSRRAASALGPPRLDRRAARARSSLPRARATMSASARAVPEFVSTAAPVFVSRLTYRPARKPGHRAAVAAEDPPLVVDELEAEPPAERPARRGCTSTCGDHISSTVAAASTPSRPRREEGRPAAQVVDRRPELAHRGDAAHVGVAAPSRRCARTRRRGSPAPAAPARCHVVRASPSGSMIRLST